MIWYIPVIGSRHITVCTRPTISRSLHQEYVRHYVRKHVPADTGVTRYRYVTMSMVLSRQPMRGDMQLRTDEFAKIVVEEGVQVVTTGAGNPGK